MRIPRLASSTDRLRPSRNSRSRRSLPDSSQSTSDVCHAAARATWMPKAANPSSSRPPSWSTVAMTPLLNQPLISSWASASTTLVRVKSLCSGESSTGARASSTHVSTTACGRSWEMCAFIPASANWMRVGVLAGTRLEQWRPGRADRRAGQVGGVRREVQVGEVHVEPGQELAGLEGAGVDRGVDEARDLPVHAVEVGHPVRRSAGRRRWRPSARGRRRWRLPGPTPPSPCSMVGRRRVSPRGNGCASRAVMR